MDQTLIAGVGNIYRAEILYKARVHPELPAASVSREQFDRIWWVMKQGRGGRRGGGGSKGRGRGEVEGRGRRKRRRREPPSHALSCAHAWRSTLRPLRSEIIILHGEHVKASWNALKERKAKAGVGCDFRRSGKCTSSWDGEYQYPAPPGPTPNPPALNLLLDEMHPTPIPESATLSHVAPHFRGSTHGKGAHKQITYPLRTYLCNIR